MSAAIAMVVSSPGPLDRGCFPSERPPAPANSALPAIQRPSILPPVSSGTSSTAYTPGGTSPRTDGAVGSCSSSSGLGLGSKTSPTSSRKESGHHKIIVKKEPLSPGLPSSRPRPRRLDLSKNTLTVSTSSAGHPLTAREGMGMHEVGIACLSPGFLTQDPVMKEQLQRSISVREQQRNIIEARLQQLSAKGDGSSDKDRDSVMHFSAKTPGMSRRNKAPPGLSIITPSPKQFADERVIQSAPLGHSFTGRQLLLPPARHANGHSSNLSNSSSIHHGHSHQNAAVTSVPNNNNRLPPISDVFASAHSDTAPVPSSLYPGHGSSRPQLSPGHPPPHHHQAPLSARPRDYKSAEEAQHELAGGRPELLPKIVHYGGHQPPTPPSPVGGARNAESSTSAGKRRSRAEYEEGSSPPLGHGPAPTRRAGPFGAGRDSPEAVRQKKEEFLKLCERAWDLFHS